MKNTPVPWGVFRCLDEIYLQDFGGEHTFYCAIYSCHSAGTTSTAIFLLREETKVIAIGMRFFVLLVLCTALRASTFKLKFSCFGARHIIYTTSPKQVRQDLRDWHHAIVYHIKRL
jgi:hypothetical protein